MTLERYDVEREIVSVQTGTAVLPVHDDVLEDEVDEDCPVDDAVDCEAELEGSSSSFCRSLPISARVSVRSSISARIGTATSTAVIRLSSTCTAQLRSLAASPTRSVRPDIMLLSHIKLLYLLSDIVVLFVFVFEQSGSAGGWMLKALNRASVSSLVFSRSWMYCDFNVGSVIHCLLAWRAENKAARRTASDVAAGSEIVVVGTRKNGKAWVGAVDGALHEPLKVKGTVKPPEVREEVEIPVLVENGSTPGPSGVNVELEVSPVPEPELEVLEPVPRGTECVVLSPIPEGAEVLVLVKPPILLLLDDPVPAMLDGPNLPRLVVGSHAEVHVPSGTDFVVLSPVLTGNDTEETLLGFGYGAPEGIAGWYFWVGEATHS